MGYWQDRIAQAQNEITKKSAKEIEEQLIRYYRSTSNKVMQQFSATYEKIQAAERKGKEPTPADLYKLDKYWQMQAQTKKELEKLGHKQIEYMSKIFKNQWIDIYNSIALKGGATYNTLDTDAIQQMINQIWCADGKSWSARIWENTDLLAATLNQELIHCVASGKTTSDLKKLLQKRFNVSYARADALAHTELAHIQTQAARQRYLDAGVKEFEVWADEDERRCEVCGKLHQKRYPAAAEVPIPAHPRCRCCIVPVVE